MIDEFETVNDEDLPGLNEDQLEVIEEAVRGPYNQRKGLAKTVKNSMEILADNPDLIEDPDKRKSFLAMDHKVAAENVCTTVNRYLWLTAMRMLEPEMVVELPTFEEYYIEAVNSGAIGPGRTTKEFCYIKDDTKLIAPYVYTYDYWEIARTKFQKDMPMIAELKKLGHQVVLFRDGPSARSSSHTFLVCLCEDGRYRMYDTYFNKYIDRPIEDRFGPGTNRYLHYAYGYARY